MADEKILVEALFGFMSIEEMKAVLKIMHDEGKFFVNEVAAKEENKIVS